MKYTLFSCRELCLAIDFLIDNIYVRFGNSVLRQVVGIPMGPNSAPLLANLSSTFTSMTCFMLTVMKQDMAKAVSFGNTSRYIDDLFSAETRKVLEIRSMLSSLRNWNWRKLPWHILLDNLIFTRNSNYLRSFPLEYSGRCVETLGPSP